MRLDDGPEVPVDPEYGVSTLWGSAFGKKLSGFSPGDQAVIVLTGHIQELAKGHITLEITECEVKAQIEDMDEAHRRAKNEVYYKSRIEVQPG